MKEKRKEHKDAPPQKKGAEGQPAQPMEQK